MKFEWDPHKAEINLRKHGVCLTKRVPYFWIVSRFRVLIPIARLMNCGTLPMECQDWGACWLFRTRTGLARFESLLPAA